MKKMFLLMTSFVFLLTGCSNADKPKNKSVTITKDSKNVEGSDDNKENKSVEKSTNEGNNEVQNKQIKHDYVEAEKLVRESLSAPLGGGMAPTYLFFYLNPNNKSEKYESKTNVTENKLSFSVDKFNEHLPETYNEDQVLESLKNKLKEFNEKYVEVDYDFETDYLKGFNDIPEDNDGFRMGAVYFKKNKIFVASTGGIGGVHLYRPIDKSQWREDGENLVVPIVEGDRGKVGEIILAFNNKEYTGGEKRSYYYVKKPYKYNS